MWEPSFPHQTPPKVPPRPPPPPKRAQSVSAEVPKPAGVSKGGKGWSSIGVLEPLPRMGPQSSGKGGKDKDIPPFRRLGQAKLGEAHQRPLPKRLLKPEKTFKRIPQPPWPRAKEWPFRHPRFPGPWYCGLRRHCPAKRCEIRRPNELFQWTEEVPKLSDEAPVFNPALSYADLETWVNQRLEDYKKGEVEGFAPPHGPGSAQAPDVAPQFQLPEGYPENFGLPDPANLLLPSGAPTSFVSASDSGGYLHRGASSIKRPTTSEAETQARLATIDFHVKHTEGHQITAKEIT